MLERVTTHFEEHRVPNPRLSIEWLLSDLLDVKRLDLYLNYDRPLSEAELDSLRPMVKRRTDHEPLQYITGVSNFLNTRLKVDRRVLIPRQETEQLTSMLLSDSKKSASAPVRMLDIGTGSGCIAIAVAAERPDWEIHAVDISTDALVLAGENARSNNVDVTFHQADLFHLDNVNLPDAETFDIIVSNPPYITDEEKPTLESQVINFEPEGALFHKNPLEVYQAVAHFASQSLCPGGTLYLECNASLALETAKNLASLFSQLDVVKDYDNNDRFIRAVKSPI